MDITPKPAEPPAEAVAVTEAFPGLRGHMPQLDGLRGIAILLVLFCHFFWKPLFDAMPVIQMGLSRVAGGGAYGVQLFFVLSGFLITGILVDNQHEKGALGRFYVRRCLRIFPLYYGVLVLLMLILPSLVPYDEAARQIVGQQFWLWSYLMNWPGAPWIWDESNLFHLGHFWSLCVEEHFYLFWPLVVYAAGRKKLVGCCLLLVGMGFLSRLGSALLGTEASMLIQWATIQKIDGLAVGSMLALLLRDGSAGRCLPDGRSLRRWMWALAAVVLVHRFWPRRLYTPWLEVFMETIVVALGALLLIQAVRSVPGGRAYRWLTARWLMSFGKYSYGLYVIHGMLRPQFQRLLPADSQNLSPWLPFVYQAGYFLFAVGFSFGAAWLSFHVFEKHFLGLKKWFPYAKAPDRARVRGLA